MGIVNVTPDSFSDGGETSTADAAIARGRQLTDVGADIIDVGGESTRPGAEPVSVDEEIRRIQPVVGALAGSGTVISIDTRHADVMSAAIEAGAKIVNDVSALSGDKDSCRVVAMSEVSVILMHMRGDPQTMQEAPVYRDVVQDISSWLTERVQVCVSAGIGIEKIAIDPGIGFGKLFEHNIDIMRAIGVFKRSGHPVCIGASRKSFLGALCDGQPVNNRLGASIAAAVFAAHSGANIIRVHDVAETWQAIRVWGALQKSESGRREPYFG
jgi:dihydropteroate synthase